ncbi:hypothetical protein TNCV_2702461 [Trichonephila clavipes]|nr:hypothetical protein TNCV_2702461 [Trichonephila clavipes]
MLPGSSTSLTALFHGCGSHLKLLECNRRHGEVVLEVRRLQKTDISSYISKRNRRTTGSAGKGLIFDMQYHGVSRHHDQWPHALHVVANGTMTGQRYIDEVLLPHVRLSVVLSVINLFFYGRQRNMSLNTPAVQHCSDSEGIQRLV